MNERISTNLGLRAPLRPAPDMAPLWQDVDLDFDTAAERFVRRHEADGAVRDFSVMDLRNLAVVPDGDRFSLKPLAGHEPPRQLRSTAFSSLCARLGAPPDFVKALPAPIQLAVLNYLMAQGSEAQSALLRLRGEEIGAVVSQRYAALDAPELVSALRTALVQHGLLQSVKVRGVATGVTDVLRLVLPNEQRVVKVGDVSLVGLDVSASSFGRAAISVRGTVFRLRCLNGLRTPSGAGQIALRHVGDAQRLRDGLAEGVATAVTHARGLITRWQAALSAYVTNLAEYIDGLRELSQGEQHALRTEFGATKPAELPERVSVYDFVNALTHTAQSAEPARRIELETMGGGILLDQTGGRP